MGATIYTHDVALHPPLGPPGPLRRRRCGGRDHVVLGLGCPPRGLGGMVGRSGARSTPLGVDRQFPRFVPRDPPLAGLDAVPLLALDGRAGTAAERDGAGRTGRQRWVTR